MKYSDGRKDPACARLAFRPRAWRILTRRATPRAVAAAKIGDGLIFGLTLARLTRVKLESATRRRAVANSAVPKVLNGLHESIRSCATRP